MTEAKQIEIRGDQLLLFFDILQIREYIYEDYYVKNWPSEWLNRERVEQVLKRLGWTYKMIRQTWNWQPDIALENGWGRLYTFKEELRYHLKNLHEAKFVLLTLCICPERVFSRWDSEQHRIQSAEAVNRLFRAILSDELTEADFKEMK